ncbi:hypothetical protein [Streptomyces sp. NPDC005017]|uniref:hypothetical protein n=1 Tax=Streptomyces sp. NPDC005017 TaxID=3364706 RepID=UPI0036A9BFA2
MEIDGVLVFAHLDPGLGALRITVHLDTAPGHLMRIDGTVPVHIEIDDTVVHEAHGAARTPLIDALLDAADDSHREAIRAAALAVGALWRCPACQWDNPDTAGCCQSPGPCGTPSPRTP